MKISLITVTYNSEKTLSETFESVLKQKYDNYEHIIVDGLSKDKTMDIVKSYEKKYANITWFVHILEKYVKIYSKNILYNCKTENWINLKSQLNFTRF